MQYNFAIQKKITDLCRLGLITEIENISKKVETPTTLLFLKNGTVPFLTPDNYQKIRHLPEIIQCPINYVADNINVLETFGKGLASFIGHKEKAVMITQCDPSQEDADGGSGRDSISIWCAGGRRKISLTEFFKMIKFAKPFLWQMPCDSETPIDLPSEKRLQKAVERTISLFHKTNAEVTKQSLPGTPLTSFTGGMNWLRRRQCLERMLDNQSVGIILDGFHGDIPINGEKLDQCMDLIEKINIRIRDQDQTKLIVLPKFHQPSQVVKAVRLGVDVFDGAFPYLLTMSRVAWVYPGFKSLAGSQWLSMVDNRFTESFDVPIDPGCDCFSCRNHTRGYVNHLIKTKELLADILLMIHNSSSYYLFFHEMRLAMAEGQFDAFHDWALDITCPSELLSNSKDVLIA